MARLPLSVQRQIDEANRLIEAVHGTEAMERSKPGGAEAAAAEGVAATAPAPGQGGDAPPSSAPAAAAPLAPSNVAPIGADPFEVRYRTLQGKYNAEIPRLSSELRASQARNASLEQQIQQLRADLESLRTRPSLVTADEHEQYSTELLDVVGRQARQTLDPELAQVRSEMNQLKTELGTVRTQVVQTAQERILALLDREVDNWREQNDDEGFGVWLDQIDPLSRMVRRDLLMRAYSGGDGDAVVAVFRAYRNEQAALQGAGQGSPLPPGTPVVGLAELTAPGRGSSVPSQGGTQNEKLIWTPALISQFYADVRRGVFRGREAEQRQYELDIAAAGREGRVSS